MKFSADRLPYMWFLGALAALPPISTDMALPAMADIAHGLDTTASVAGLTLSLFMLGFAVSPIAYGPLSDRFGRRPALLAGLGLFVLGNALATFGHSIDAVLLGRVVQGAGAGAGMTIAFAMVRDQFDGVAAQTRLAMITIVANLAPIVAPALGTALLKPMGWRGIYGVTLSCGVALAAITLLALAETRGVRSGTVAAPLQGKQNPHGYLLKLPVVRGHILVNGLGFGWMFAYVAGSPLTLLGVFHVSPPVYSMMFACTGAGIVAGATLNGRLVKRGVASGTLLMAGIVLAVLSSFVLLCLTALDSATVQRVMPLFVICTFSFGLVAPSATHGAMTPVPSLAGVTGGLLTSIQMIFGALTSTMVVLLFAHLGLLALAFTMLGAALLAAGIYWPLHRQTRLSAVVESAASGR